MYRNNQYPTKYCFKCKNTYCLSDLYLLQCAFVYPIGCLFLLFVVAEHLTAQHSAIKMLHTRVKIILNYIKAVENGLKLFLLYSF